MFCPERLRRKRRKLAVSQYSRINRSTCPGAAAGAALAARRPRLYFRLTRSLVLSVTARPSGRFIVPHIPFDPPQLDVRSPVARDPVAGAARR